MSVLFSIPLASALLPTLLLVLLWLIVLSRRRHRDRDVTRAPAVAGALPLLGNALKIDRRRPHFTLTDWANVYGHVYR